MFNKKFFHKSLSFNYSTLFENREGNRRKNDRYLFA